MGDEHAKISPSAIDRWITCHGSVGVQTDDPPGPHAVWGTAAHWVAEQCLNTNKDTRTYIEVLDPDGTEITEEMTNCAQVYVDFCRMKAKEYPRANIGVESRVSLEGYGLPHVYGTADYVVNDPFNELVVVDFKSGRGISVDADSLQLRLYGVMAAGDMLETYERIRCIIVQPRDKRGEYIKEHVYTPEELMVWMIEEVAPAIEDIESDNPTFQPSEKACRWCSINGKCIHQAKAAVHLADNYNPIFNPNVLHPDVIAQLLRQADFFANWLKGLKDQAIEMLKQGETIPGFKLVESITKSKFDDTQDVGKILYKEVKLKKRDIYEEKLRPISYILSKTPKLKQPLVEKLIVKPQGYPTIAPSSDKRPALDMQADVDDMFKDIDDTE